MDGQGTKCRKNIAENLNRLSRAHERYRRQTDRQTDDRQTDGQATANSTFANYKTCQLSRAGGRSNFQSISMPPSFVAAEPKDFS